MLNNVNLCGRLTADPELKTTPSGVSVTTFNLAVERDYQSNGEKKTDFIPIVAWRNTAEFAAKYFNKGKMMIVNGRLEMRDYQAKDGSKRTIAEVIADHCYFAGDKQQIAPQFAAPVQQPPNVSADDFEEVEDDDLPF